MTSQIDNKTKPPTRRIVILLVILFLLSAASLLSTIYYPYYARILPSIDKENIQFQWGGPFQESCWEIQGTLRDMSVLAAEWKQVQFSSFKEFELSELCYLARTCPSFSNQADYSQLLFYEYKQKPNIKARAIIHKKNRSVYIYLVKR